MVSTVYTLKGTVVDMKLIVPLFSVSCESICPLRVLIQNVYAQNIYKQNVNAKMSTVFKMSTAHMSTARVSKKLPIFLAWMRLPIELKCCIHLI